jgi:hypothetical protein
MCLAGSTLITILRASVLTIWVGLAEDPEAIRRSHPQEYANIELLREEQRQRELAEQQRQEE